MSRRERRKRLHLSPWAVSSVEIHAEVYADPTFDDQDYPISPLYQALQGAFHTERRRGQDGEDKDVAWLEVTPDNAALLLGALIDLANTEDGQAEACGKDNPEGRQHAQWAMLGLSAATERLAAIMKALGVER